MWKSGNETADLFLIALYLVACGDQSATQSTSASAPQQPTPEVQAPPASVVAPAKKKLVPAELPAVATGAVIDESTIAVTVRVDPADPKAQRNLLAGLQTALISLAKGQATRVVVAPGVYRDDASMLRFDAPVVRDTLLVIEAAAGGDVIWTGSDTVVDSTWQDDGAGLWSTPWSANFGNFTYPWGEPLGVGPRREMVFDGDQALLPVALETYAIEGHNQFPKPGEKVTWTSKVSLNPMATLQAGQFGVSDERKRL